MAHDLAQKRLSDTSIPRALELVLRKDRNLVIVDLFVIAALAWTYMIYLAWNMSGMEMAGPETSGGEMAMPQIRFWGLIDFLLMFVMWRVMMVAMMYRRPLPWSCCSPPSTGNAASTRRPTCRRRSFFSATFSCGRRSARLQPSCNGGYTTPPCYLS